MAQIFHRSTNTIARFSIFGSLFAIALAGWALAQVNRSSYVTQERVIRQQPVPFSHNHHVATIGIDCRYCHTSVETSSFAGMPPTETCMNCHSQIWADSPMLEPVRDSFRTGKALRWTRVHDLPDFVYFNHSIHVAKGIGCESCHGRVDKMPLVWAESPLTMEWCLSCHRHPEKHVRPKSEVFRMGYVPAKSQEELGLELVKEYGIESKTYCSTCHR